MDGSSGSYVVFLISHGPIHKAESAGPHSGPTLFVVSDSTPARGKLSEDIPRKW
jgi:hypothetical protein